MIEHQQSRSTVGTAYRASRIVAAMCVICVPPAASGQQKIAGTSAVVAAATASNAAAASAGPSDLAHRDLRYQLCASDVIAISFPLTPEFNQTVTIQPDGFATFTAVGDVRLGGLTTDQSIQAIRTAYSNILHDPIVTLELKKFNEPYFIVGGQVRQPGKYDLRGYTTATQAVAMAGGFNNDAKHSQVLLFRRVNNDWFEVKDLNLKRILQGRDVAEDPELHSGDMLFVPQNAISKIKRLIPAYGVGTYYQLYR